MTTLRTRSGELITFQRPGASKLCECGMPIPNGQTRCLPAPMTDTEILELIGSP